VQGAGQQSPSLSLGTAQAVVERVAKGQA